MGKKLKVGIFFGGKSVEHEVSVITALQAYENIDKEKYDVIPVYVSKDGKFYSDQKLWDIKNYKDLDSLLLSITKGVVGSKNGEIGIITTGWFPKVKPIDIAFPMFHGSFGEDGCIQGVFEIYQIPYVGLSVAGAALSMDKILQKAVYKELGLNVGRYFVVKRTQWLADSKNVLKRVQDDENGGLKYPMFVKPATIGSSIGINLVRNEDSLSFAIEVASTYSDKILIEEAYENCIEVNCSTLGYGEDVKASVCEMPVASSDVLSFEDKYKRGGKGSKGKGASGSVGGAGMASLTRIIPAPIPDILTRQIQAATVKIFKAFDGCGVARVDYFVDSQKQKFWVNEINSPPGSLAFYLWEKSGIPYKELLDKMIEYSLMRSEDQKKTQYTFESGLLQQIALSSGSKN